MDKNSSLVLLITIYIAWCLGILGMQPVSAVMGIIIIIRYMALGKSLNLSKPQFPYLENREAMRENAL